MSKRNAKSYTGVLALLKSSAPRDGTHWRHVASGAEYVVLFSGLIEADLTPAVAYRRADDPECPVWFRPLGEFMDGRFAQITGD